MTLCCTMCFQDEILKSRPVWQSAEVLGVCSYCRSVGHPTQDPSLPRLQDAFTWIADTYESDPAGTELWEMLKLDWGFFSTMSDVSAKQLATAIAPSVGARVLPRALPGNMGFGDWNNFKAFIKGRNRFFANESLQLTGLSGFIERIVTTVDSSSVWNRARINTTNLEFTDQDLQAPPAKLARGGRANPDGIPYLYLANASATAIAEVRPHPGSTVSVGTFQLDPGLKLVDLRAPREQLSPFAGADDQGTLRLARPLLHEVALDLGRPVLPHLAAMDYLPTQFICEWLKNLGYHGVMFRSSVWTGDNLVLFDPTKAHILHVQTHQVETVEFRLVR